MKALPPLAVLIALPVLILHAQNDEPTGFAAPTKDSSTVENTATGKSALGANSTGSYNTATGGYALEKNASGSHNTATGYYALNENTAGMDNTADGFTALNLNTTGRASTGLGSYALEANTTGASNTALGSYALTANTIGESNTALGRAALFTNKTGSLNVAAGFYALYFTTGSHNTAVGTRALNYLGAGENNCALGYEAGYDVTSGSDNIELGSPGEKADTATIRLGRQGTQQQTFVAGIFGTTAAAGVPVVVTPNGQLGTVTSSARFKRDIHDMADASDAVLALRPVTFEYQPSIDPQGRPQFGLVAEEVEKVAPELVVRDAANQVYSVRYDAVNAMLLNEVQKQRRTIDKQSKLLEELSARVERLERTDQRD